MPAGGDFFAVIGVIVLFAVLALAVKGAEKL